MTTPPLFYTASGTKPIRPFRLSIPGPLLLQHWDAQGSHPYPARPEVAGLPTPGHVSGVHPIPGGALEELQLTFLCTMVVCDCR